MPLNLGNINKNALDDMSFEDAYIAWLEADQQFMNFMNAYEIAKKAKASQSSECIAFAEELLGCSLEDFEASLEVQFRPTTASGRTPTAMNKARYAHYMTGKSPELENMFNSLRLAKKRLIRLKSRLSPADGKRIIQIPEYINHDDSESTTSQSTTVADAVSKYIKAIESQVKYFAPIVGSGLVHTFDSKSEYVSLRRDAAKLLKDLRSFVRKVDAIVDNRINS